VTGNRAVAWAKERAWVAEIVDVSRDRLSATGAAIGWDPVAYVLSYTLETGG
jgi:hypothetical protein